MGNVLYANVGRSEIVLYVLNSTYVVILLGFEIDMMLACFDMCGIMLVLRVST